MVLHKRLLLVTTILAWQPCFASGEKSFTFLVPDSPHEAEMSSTSYTLSKNKWSTKSCESDEFLCATMGSIVIVIPKTESLPHYWDYSGMRFCVLQSGHSSAFGRYFQLYAKSDVGRCNYLTDERVSSLVYSCEFGIRYMESLKAGMVGVRLVSTDKYGFGAGNCKDVK